MSKAQIAEAWCTNGAQWRTVKHRYGVQGSGLVRVARMPPEECMEEVLAFLTSAAGCTGLFLDGKPLSDRFLPLAAWYERTTAANRVETVEVYHALRDKDDAEAFGPVSVRNGCTYLEEHTFYWSVAELPAVPASSSGIDYTLEGIRRDEESGLYSCVLVKRTRVQVNVDAYLSHDDALSERTTAQMLGVRVTEKLVDGNSVLDENGKPMMNTVDEQIEAFATKQGLKTAGGTGGVVVDIQKSKNDDCTTDVTIHNTEEQTVEAAEKTETEDRYSKTTRTVNRSQAADGALTNPSVTGTVERVTNVKTPGGLVDVTTEKTEAKQNVESGNSEAQTIFETRKTEDTRNATSEAAAEAPFSGTLKQVENVYNSDGTINTRVTTTNEQPVSTAEQTLTEDRYSKTTRTVDRNQGSAGTLPATPTTGTIKRVANAKTPGDLYNVTTETTIAKPSTGGTGIESGNSEVRTQFEIRTTEDKRNATAELSPVAAGSGKVTQVENVYNPDGTINTRKTETTEQNVASVEVVDEVDALKTVKRTLNRGQANALGVPAFANNTILRHRSVKTPGKLNDTEVTTTTAKKAVYIQTLAPDRNGTSRTITVFRNCSETEADGYLAAAHSGSATPNEFGLYDGSCTTVHNEDDNPRVARARRDYREYEQSQTGKEIRIVNANGKTYKVTETYTYKVGVIHDSDPVTGSANNPYTKVAGCSSPRVQYLGDGYWSYYGITTRQITWENVEDSSDTIIHTM